MFESGFLVVTLELYQTQGCLFNKKKKWVRVPKAVMYHTKFLKCEERWELQLFRKYISRMKIIFMSFKHFYCEKSVIFLSSNPMREEGMKIYIHGKESSCTAAISKRFQAIS